MNWLLKKNSVWDMLISCAYGCQVHSYWYDNGIWRVGVRGRFGSYPRRYWGEGHRTIVLNLLVEPKILHILLSSIWSTTWKSSFVFIVQLTQWKVSHLSLALVQPESKSMSILIHKDCVRYSVHKQWDAEERRREWISNLLPRESNFKDVPQRTDIC